MKPTLFSGGTSMSQLAQWLVAQYVAAGGLYTQRSTLAEATADAKLHPGASLLEVSDEVSKLGECVRAK